MSDVVWPIKANNDIPWLATVFTAAPPVNVKSIQTRLVGGQSSESVSHVRWVGRGVNGVTVGPLLLYHCSTAPPAHDAACPQLNKPRKRKRRSRQKTDLPDFVRCTVRPADTRAEESDPANK